MDSWAASPFRGWEPIQVRSKLAPARWKLCRVPGNCVGCKKKRTNRHCVANSCKPCCLARGGCNVHKVPSRRGGGGGGGVGGSAAAAAARAAAGPQTRNKKRCRTCGCSLCQGNGRKPCNSSAAVQQAWTAALGGAAPSHLRMSKVAVCLNCKAACWVRTSVAVPAVVRVVGEPTADHGGADGGGEKGGGDDDDDDDEDDDAASDHTYASHEDASGESEDDDEDDDDEAL